MKRPGRSSNNKNNCIAATCFAIAALGTVSAANGQVNVTEHHNHPSRDGLYIDPSFTPAGAAGLTRDLGFNGSISGNVYAQPLYIEGGPAGRAMVIAVTESNNVYALDATNGTIIWQANVGSPVPSSALPCGNLSPYGITGTPIVDLPSRALFFDAMVMEAGSPEHLIYSLDVDTGSINPGWPVNVGASASFGGTAFTPLTQGQRGALAIVGTNVYVPFGGLDGDCDTYYGWVVGVPLSNPGIVMTWATSAVRGGIWSVNGVSSDGTSPFFATGNTYNAGAWGGGEAIINPLPNLVLPSGNYWAPVNWASLDSSDLDLGSSGALLVNVPGATPSELVAAFGKDGNAYLLNRTSLGGISAPVAKLNVASGVIITAAATYQTSKGTYIVYSYGGNLNALRVGASNPPTLTSVWSASEGGSGSPFVTSTDGSNNVVVWGIGSESDQRLHAFDGDTGAAIFTGGGANELMAGTRRRNTGIVARGRIYVANDNMVYAFNVASNPPVEPSPVANNDSYNFSENTTLTVGAPGVLANDTDNAGFSLSAVLANGPAHGSLNLNANGGFTYSPVANFSGTDSFTYYDTDGLSNSAVATVTLNGLPAGVLFSDNFSRSTNPGPLTPWVDETGSWTVTGGMMQGSGASGYGNVYITNSWSNYSVQASIRFSSANGYGAGISGRLNPATGARYAAWVYPEGSPISGPLLRLIKFQNWSGWSYQGSTYMPMQQTSLPSVGTNWHTLQLSFQGNQIIVSYDGTQYLEVADAETTPYANGAVGIELYASSTAYTFSVDNVSVTGAAPVVHSDPVANNDSYNFSENTTLTVAAPGVLANDTDTAGFTVNAVLARGPAHGTLTLNPNGSFAYNPATNFSGTDSFTYYASDGTSNSPVATVTLTGEAAGVLFSDNFSRSTNPGPLAPWVEESGSWTVTGGMMLGNSSANSYGAAYITNSWSNYTVQASIQFSTTSAYGAGIDGRLNPANGARYAAWVYPENSPVGGPMVRLVKFQSWTSWSYQGVTYKPMEQASLAAVGTNWHTLQLTLQGNQITVSFDGNQVLSATDAEASPYSSGAVGLDMYGQSTSYAFAIENVLVTGSVTAPEPDPVAKNDSYPFTENTTLTVPAPGVLANDTDTAGYTLSAVLAAGPSQGTVTLNPNGSFTYTPATNFSGTDSFTYYASDGSSNSGIAVVTLNGSASGVLFSDNFSRATNPGPLAPWLAESGSWTVTGGMLEGNSSANGYGAAYITNSWSNYTVQASIQFSTANGYGAGISGRLNPSTGARYAAWVYPEGSPAKGPMIRLIKFQSWTSWSYEGASYTPIQQASLSSVSTNWHTLQLSFQGNQMTVSFDGNQVLSATDGEASPYSSGAVGFDLYTGPTSYTVNFENASVNQ